MSLQTALLVTAPTHVAASIRHYDHDAVETYSNHGIVMVLCALLCAFMFFLPYVGYVQVLKEHGQRTLRRGTVPCCLLFAF